VLSRGSATARGVTWLLCVLSLMATAPALARPNLWNRVPEAPGFSATLDGHVVQHRRVGYQPDFDPIDRVVISAMLRHVRSAGVDLPDTMLVLSLYLENFTDTTTPLLPDLLHPDQPATGIGGFMQGKAVLITAAGRKGFDGSVLAEVFLDNTVHIALDLVPSGASVTTPTQRLLGTFTLESDLSLRGALDGSQSLAAQVLRVPRGRPIAWQSVVAGLAVRIPPMMGTVTSRLPSQRAPVPLVLPTNPVGLQPHIVADRASTVPAVLVVSALVIIIGVLSAALFVLGGLRPARRTVSGHAPPPEPRVEGRL